MGVSRIVIPAQAQSLLRRLNAAGYAAYAVGGCVRDSLRGETPADWDLCTDAEPSQTAAVFADCRTVLTGVRYGTVTVIFDGTPFEITTFREEYGYSDSRHPDGVSFLRSLEGDLARRDFTINAMAADADGSVIDRFGGAEDIRRGVIRCVGDPAQRFTEDALRMLRALRFAARLGFAVAPETEAAIHALCGRLRAVAPERLRKELSGLLCGQAVSGVLERFSDVICVLIPELKPCIGFRQWNHHHKYDVWEHTLRAVGAVAPTEPLRLAMLLHDIGKPAAFTMDKQLVGHFYGHAVIGAAMCEQILHRLRYDNRTAELVTLLVREHGFHLLPDNAKRMKKLLSLFGEDTVRLLLQVRRADGIATGTAEGVTEKTAVAERLLESVSAQCVSLPQLELNGEDLLRLGVPQGPRIGAILRALLDSVLDGSMENDRAVLLQAAREMIDKSDVSL
ncbi:MAG: HD domain-containing protein [Oscillospiraceae bacterium]|nr:HD domain-containing protein [Oscillospiraceae bacterium]